MCPVDGFRILKHPAATFFCIVCMQDRLSKVTNKILAFKRWWVHEELVFEFDDAFSYIAVMGGSEDELLCPFEIDWTQRGFEIHVTGALGEVAPRGKHL